jgi:hypothetical protein
MYVDTETREEMIARWEQAGILDPSCLTCQGDFYAVTDKRPADIHAPRHKASPGCESGKHPHCTCDVCW